MTDAEYAFLKGLRVYGDEWSITSNERGWAVIFGSDGDAVAHVRGAPNDDVSAEQAARALVTAAHEWVTFAKVIEAAKSLVQCAENNDIAIVAAKGVASKFDDSLSALAAAIDTALKEAPDA